MAEELTAVSKEDYELLQFVKNHFKMRRGIARKRRESGHKTGTCWPGYKATPFMYKLSRMIPDE